MNSHRRHRLARALVNTLVSMPFYLCAAHTAETQSSVTNYASLQALPDFSGWWEFDQPLSAEFLRHPLPLRSEDVARMREARSQDLEPDPGRYCRPHQFVGYSGGFAESVEFLFTPGRVTLINESGLVRRIYTDGRTVPNDLEATNTGMSIGWWEGDTLVVETVGIRSDAKYPPSQGPGSLAIGRNVKIVERIVLKDKNTLEFDVLTIAPDVLTKPDRRTRTYKRISKQTVRETSPCVEHDRSIDPISGKQRLDMTPPADLPPPPK